MDNSAAAMANLGFHPRPFSCEKCDKSFESARDLRLHVAQHKWGPHKIIQTPGGVLFQCLHENCHKVVKDRKILRKHLLTHQDRKFVCAYEGCGKRFYERAKLKRHFLVHTGEKNFSCPFPNCKKDFAYKANLKTHIRTHTGQRPFACTWPGCTKRFAQASNRNSHVETHSKNGRKRKHSAVENMYPAENVQNVQPSYPEPFKSMKPQPTFINPYPPMPFMASPSHQDTINTLLLLGAGQMKGLNQPYMAPTFPSLNGIPTLGKW